MKALIGVDSLGQCASAIELVRRLDLPLEKLILLHSVESIMPDGSFPGLAPGGTYVDMLGEFERAGHLALDQAQAASAPGAPVEKQQIPGDPLRNLLDVADDAAADLIAVGTQKKSSIQAALLGSVTRGLLTASTHSFLAAKDGFKVEGPLTAVIATDHSDYANRVLELFIRFAPRGIGKVIVLSVLDPRAQKAVEHFQGDSELSDNVAFWAEDRLHHANKAVCDKLQGLIETCEERVMVGEVNASIAEAMAEANADILILGAQGHGFLERLRSGSVSYHQVVAETYPVLVMRA